MPTIITIPTEEVIALYKTGKFSMNKLAKHFGVSRQAVWYHLHGKRQTSQSQRTMPVKVLCDGCGKEFEITRGRGRPGKYFYCGAPCKAPAQKEVWKELAKEILE